MPGTLWVVATPLGNLDDLSPRALETLRSVECIACEDTRRTSRLLARFDVRTRLISCHRFNERRRLEPVLTLLREGESVALVSDGGTPGVSDPGALLVAAALADGIPVRPVPGPSAVVALLSASGLAGDRFVFDGFLPHRAGERRRRLRALREEIRPVVLFETPHRIRETLDDIAEVLGERPLVLGREMTKVHETIFRGTAREAAAALPEGEVRGEITLVIAGAPEQAAGTGDREARAIRDTYRAALEEAEGDRRRALKRAARELGMDRSELSRRLAELGED